MRGHNQILMRSALDLSCALLMQLTLLGGMLVIFKFDSLRNLAYFTFALSICGPISLFSSMSLVELLFSGDHRYRNVVHVGIAQLVCYIILVFVFGTIITFWDSSYLLVFAIVAFGRGADLMSSLSIHVMRARGCFNWVALIGLFQFILFIGLASTTLVVEFARPVVEIAVVVALVSVVQAGISLFWLREVLAECADGQPLRPFVFIRSHLFRSGAISLNSVQSNAPRYGLELLVSPQHQAAYSLIFTVVRAGTILFQSIFVPTVGLFKLHYIRAPHKAIFIASIAFLISSITFSGFATLTWQLLVIYKMQTFLGQDLLVILTPSVVNAILVGCGFYLFRFGLWQIVSLLDSGFRQFGYALAGVSVTIAGVGLLTPHFGIVGATVAEVAGNLILVLLPLIFWMRRPSEAKSYK